MSKLKISCLALILCFAAQPCFAISGVPSLEFSEASTAFTGPGLATLLVDPIGMGLPFTEARDESGAVVDATVTLILRDSGGFPIANFPREDIWLGSAVGTFSSCLGGSSPDTNTDAAGMTSWTLSPAAGGYSESPLQVFVNGSPLAADGMSVRIISPDINGSGYVELSDVSILAGDYFSQYHFRSDFNVDGVLNLSDIAIFVDSMGAWCP